MPYVSYADHSGTPRTGVLEGDTIVPLDGIQSIDAHTDTDQLASASRRDGQAVLLDSVRLLPASPHPRRVLCVGLNYRTHIAETGRGFPTYPVLFPKFASNLIGARDDIVLPAESTEPDYEGELAIVIGRSGRRIPVENAGEHILGFTVANDVTMRDYQYKTHQWLQGKAWDDSTPVGPVIVTPDEFDIDDAVLTTHVNGREVQRAKVDDLVFGVPTLVSLISTFTRLDVGDLILTGTPGGVGYRRKPQLLLSDGDVVSVHVTGIGAVENAVVRESVDHAS